MSHFPLAVTTTNMFRRECSMATDTVISGLVDSHREPGRYTLRFLTSVHVRKLHWFKDCIVNGDYVRIPDHGWITKGKSE